MRDLHAGASGELRLTGSVGSYEVSARIISVGTQLVHIELADGRRLTVPLQAILGFSSAARSATATDANAGAAPGARAIVDRSVQSKTAHSIKPRPDEDADAIPAVRTQASAMSDVSQLASSISNFAHVEHSESSANSEGATLTTEMQSLRIALEQLSESSDGRSPRAIRDVQRLLDTALRRLEASSFAEATELRRDYESKRIRAKRTLDFMSRQSRLAKCLRDTYRCVVASELEDWKRLCSRNEARPRLITQDNLNLTVSKAGEVLLPLKVILDEGPVPARGIRVVLDQHRGVETVGNLPSIEELQPGQTRTVRVRLRDRRRQGAKNEVRVSAHLEYFGANDERNTSPRQNVSLRLSKPADFAPMPNPFRDYASGAPIDDPEMFFGRAALVNDIVAQLTERPVGRCYALYGQKRSGKSSLINRVESALSESGALVAHLSMGVVDRSAITQTFMSEIIDQLRQQVADALDEQTFSKLLTRWPDAASIASQPLASLRRALTASRALLKSAGREAPPRVVVIVDEFTYLFELLRRDNVAPADQDQLRDFMRQWKSLLEAKLFSALVVGQDTMPAFISAFPNEFSVMHTAHLDYLTSTETAELADLPIRRKDGTTRFSGYGLPSIHAYTSGHPYFTQILCDRIVELCNENRRQDIADFDVDAAIETLLDGSREIGMFRFDCLLTADNTGILVTDPEAVDAEWESHDLQEVALRICTRMVRLGAEQNKPVGVEELSLSIAERRVMEDLVSRSVITVRDGKASIRVMLFAEYLRRRLT